jgi:hypothetical protein
MLVIVTDFAILILPFRVCAFKGFEVIYREKTIEHDLTTENLYHLRLLAECTFFVIYKAVYLT